MERIMQDKSSMLSEKHLFLSTAEVAKMLGVKPGTLKQWRCQKKHLCYHELGGRVVYCLEDVMEYLRKNRKEVQK